MTVSLGRGVPARDPALRSHIIPGRRGAVINNKLTFFQLNEIGGHLINFHFVAVGSVPFDRRPTRVGTRTSHDPHSASTCHHALCACPLGRKICNFPVITSGVFDVPVATNLTQVLNARRMRCIAPQFHVNFPCSWVAWRRTPTRIAISRFSGHCWRCPPRVWRYLKAAPTSFSNSQALPPAFPQASRALSFLERPHVYTLTTLLTTCHATQSPWCSHPRP